MKKIILFFFPALLIFASLPLSAAGVLAQDAEEPVAQAPIPEPTSFVTQHRIRTVDGELRYTATAEEIYTRDENGNPIASFFTTSYTLDGVSDRTQRPVTFVFNGGPGSASIWLHMGLVGPRLVDIPSDAKDPGLAPYNFKDNPYTILRATDIVFIDPIGTGYSKPLGDKKNEDFWGYAEDGDSVAEFIRTYITAKNRWNSPKFILGESYGGIRIGMLLPRLNDLGIYLNGLVFIAPALNMGTLPYLTDGNDISYVTQLPGYAAAAWYHGAVDKGGKTFEAFLQEVEDFASTEYLAALYKGDSLPQDRKETVAAKIAGYTGVSMDFVMKSNLRFPPWRFRKEFKRESGIVIGRLDARYMKEDIDPASSDPFSDPFDAHTTGIYTALFQDYLKNTLGVDFVKQYIPSNGQAGGAWKRPQAQQNAFAGYVDVTPNLTDAALANEDLKFFFAAGYYDLATTFSAIKYSIDRTGIAKDRITFKPYQGGHMMYLHQPSLEELSNDIAAFIRGQ